MIYKLTKCSSPGWTKDFMSEREVTEELAKHICRLCIAPEGENEWGDPVVPTDMNNYHDMLNTGCGLEFEIEEI